MPRIHLLPLLGIVAALSCGGALAQTSTSPSTPETSGTSEPAQQMSSSSGASADDMGGSSSSGGKHHKKAPKKSKTPKPAENDNNAAPNSAAPQSAPTQSPQ